MPLKISIGGYQPLNSTLSQSVGVFANGLRARLGGQVEIEFRNDIAAEGLAPNQMPKLVESGDLTMGYLAASYFADLLPESRVFDVPFAVQSRDQAYRFLDSGYGARQAEQLAAKTGLKLLGIWDYGFRHITNARGPIRRPADCAGLRLRILLNDLHPRIFQTLGFETFSSQVPEFLARLRAGEDIAQENALTNFYNFGMHKFHRHISLSFHLLGLANFLCSKSAYEDWPEDIKAAVTESAAEATARQRAIAAADEAAVLASLKAEGCDVIQLTDDERGEFEQALSELMAEYRHLIGPELFEALDNCRAG